MLTQKTKGNPHRRRLVKWRLTKLLFQRDWDRRRIVDLYRMIDWMMRLPEGLDRRFRSAVYQLEGRDAMPYITNFERAGLERGRKEGRQELLAAQLARRFGALDAAVAERLARASVEQLSAWALNFVDAHSLDEVFRTP